MDGDRLRANFAQAINAYVDGVWQGLQLRWDSWPIDTAQNVVHEVVGGLLARQTALAVDLISTPPMWTPNIAPLVLRAMVEVRITLSWILHDPRARAKKFVLYGAGHAKLIWEHAKADAVEAGQDPERDPALKQMELWINAQRFHFLTEVNVGSWADIDLRTMAAECGCEQLYRSDYPQLSACTHSMWHHIHPFNLQPCENPLHRGGHRVPFRGSYASELDFALRAADYLDDTLEVFDAFRGEKPDCLVASIALRKALESIAVEMHDSGEPSTDSERS